MACQMRLRLLRKLSRALTSEQATPSPAVAGIDKF